MEVNLTQLLELAVQQGIWAVLYIYLFFRMLKENKEREEKYQTMIDRLSGNIEDGIEKIHQKLDALAGDDANEHTCKQWRWLMAETTKANIQEETTMSDNKTLERLHAGQAEAFDALPAGRSFHAGNPASSISTWAQAGGRLWPLRRRYTTVRQTARSATSTTHSTPWRQTAAASTATAPTPCGWNFPPARTRARSSA